MPQAQGLVTEDKVPTYLLNGLVTAVVVACAAYMGTAPLRVLSTTIPVEGLPLSRVAVLPAPAPPPTVRAPVVSPDLALAQVRRETPVAARAVTEAKPRDSTTEPVETVGPRRRDEHSTRSAAALARIRAAATERAAMAAEGVTRSFAGTPGSSAGMRPADPQQPATQPAP
jgi:hypothetical protein